MATQTNNFSPLPRQLAARGRPSRALAPIDRAVACLDEATKAQSDADAPSPEAVDKARELLNNLSFWVNSIPEPDAVFSLDGGVQVAWKNEDLHVRLFCAPTPSKSYIYISYTTNGKTAESLMMPSVDVFTLADSLHWLRTREWPTPPSRP